MAEFEAERRMPADAEQVFAIVGDLDRLAEWMPAPIGVRPEQLRLEWGSEGSPDYAGWLQVEHAEAGHSSVLMHLSFLGDQPEARRHGSAADEVRQWLDDALSRLERVVAGTS
jgi:hypothetical protein